MSRIVTCELPPHVQSGHLLTRCTTETGTVAIIARPGTKNAVVPLIHDIIIATSHRPQPASIPKAASTVRNIALARLTGYGIRHVIVCSSDNLSCECLDTLSDLVTSTGADLTLLYGYDSGTRIRAWGQGHNAEDVDWDTVEPLIPGSPEQAYASGETFPDEVPWVDYPLFRATARDLLDEDDFHQVDLLYCQTFKTITAQQPTTTEEAAQALHVLLSTANHPAKTITIVRAAQAALLKLGRHLKVDLKRLHLTAIQGTLREMTDDDYLTLRDEPDPHVAAIAVLANLKMENADIHALRLTDITPDGNLARSPNGLPPLAASLLATLRQFRLLQGSTPEDPLIDKSPRAIPAALRNAAQRGVPVDVSRAQTAKADRWQHQHGIHLWELR